MKNLFKYLFITCQLWLAHSAMAYVTIGTDIDCDYQTNAVSIEELIQSGETVLRITNQTAVNGSIQIASRATILGGFNNCTDARNTQYSDTPTTFNGNQLGPVFKINSPSNAANISVYLKSLKITNGINQSVHHGGGVSVFDNSGHSINVTIEDSLIVNNRGNRGGGIFINGDGVWVSLYNTLVLNNEVLGTAAGTAMGGGVYCLGGHFWMRKSSGISGNQAYSSVSNAGFGGGIFATNGCDVALQSGTEGGLFDFRGISNNSASSHGGGIYLSNGARITGNSTDFLEPINISNNLADSNKTGYGDGGGIFMSGVSTGVSVSGLILNNNEAVNGGGVAIKNGAFMLVYLGSICWNKKQCNQISGNRTDHVDGIGGALYLSGGATRIEHTHLTLNKATDGSVLYAENDSSVTLSRSLIHSNGSHEAGLWSDQTIYNLNESNIIMSHITSASNQAEAATIRQVNSQHNISNSLFDEGITNQFGNFINASGEKKCLLLDNDFGIGSNVTDVMVGSPSLDANFHLTEDSLAIDRCLDIVNNNSNSELDIDGELAPYDHPDINSGQTILDIGADEFISDLIFADSFEVAL